MPKCNGRTKLIQKTNVEYNENCFILMYIFVNAQGLQAGPLNRFPRVMG